MRRGLLTIVCMVVLVWGAFAQDQADQAKYELIRETINFLATDKAVSKDTNFRISCETLDYDCFKQQLSNKPIAGIERWYNSWRSMTATDEAGLVALRDQLFADILERPGKGYRKKLAGYDGYSSRIEYLIHQYADGMPMEEAAVDTAPAPPINPAELHPTNPEQLTNDNPEKDDTMIAYLAIAIGIIALIIAALPIFKKREQQLPTDFQGLQEQLDELAVRMKRLEQRIADNETKDAIASLTEIMESVEKRVVELENSSESDTD
ncbi:hypothetical protein [Parapedobacter tibetensis]|uniref:hypothetical protein n=1 Tax=Parapedobacter tibetensis TaxID=2972951 RepID=UPI00214D9315|nr:hypothetical protein [Parapedobacter tibetensis]